MDRFIELLYTVTAYNTRYLKSNMDRFIGLPNTGLAIIYCEFKIQYG